MIRTPGWLDQAERAATRRFLERAMAPDAPPLARALLFGSKARGDFDGASDVDLLLVCDVSPAARDAASAWHARVAAAIGDELDARLETWTVPAIELVRGRRTPMLVDAVADGVQLWPAHAPPLDVAFTPEDADICARCLLDWVDAGGDVVRNALARGDRATAAGRARDDIVRLATAALLLTGYTRHRKAGALEDFRARFLDTGAVSAAVLPALRWAAAAYPPDGGRGEEVPRPSYGAMRTAGMGYEYAALAEREVLPVVLEMLEENVGRCG